MPNINANGIENRVADSIVEDKNALRSEPVRDFISSKPSFFVRKGMLLIFFVIILLLSETWFIHYPEIVDADAILTSVNTPKEVVARADGRIIKLWVKQNEKVNASDLIAFTESTADHMQVIRMAGILDSAYELLNNNKPGVLPQLLVPAFNQSLSFGELQQAFQVFRQAWQKYSNYLSSGFYQKRVKMLQDDAFYLSKLNGKLQLQKELIERDETLAETTFHNFKKLAEQKVISSLEYRQEESKAISKRQTLPQMDVSILSNELQQHDKYKEVELLRNEIEQQQLIFTEALNTFRSQIDEWEKKYVVKAPCSGIFEFSSALQENHFFNANKTIGFVVPVGSFCFAELQIPQSNLGKIQRGQAVLLKFDAYPYEQFGTVKGVVDYVSDVPNDSGFLARVIVPQNLQTSYHKKIHYRTGLKAAAEIITEDMRLPQYLMSDIRKILNKRN